MISGCRALLAGSLLLLANCDVQSASPPTLDFGNSAANRTPAIPLSGRVTDAAGTLGPAQEAALSAKLEGLERLTKRQMVIVTVPSLGGQDIAAYTRNLANSWGIGRKGYNDGVVLLVAPNEQRVRIAVGLGLEEVLTHEVCQGIIDNSMLPRFRAGDLIGGIEAGTDALIVHLS
jgi:uncharacterized protein